MSASRPAGFDGPDRSDSRGSSGSSGPSVPSGSWGSSGSSGSSGSAGAPSGPGWFGDPGAGPRGRGSSAADRTEILGARIGGHGRRVPGPDPSAQGRITWGTTDPAGASPGNFAPSHGPTDAVPGNAAPGPDLFGKAPHAAPAPGAAHHAHGAAHGTGAAQDPDRTDVLPSAGPTRAFPAPAPIPPPGPATAALRDPWQELPDTDGDAGPGTGAAGHTHDPHEVTVQLDAVHLGDGQLLRADRGHRKSGPEPSEGPVFVDASGRRSRLYRRLGIVVGIACAVYAVVIVSTLLSGNSDAPWMPVPGQQEGAPAGQVDTSPLPSESAQPSGAAVPQTSPSADAGTATAPGAGAPASGTSGVTGGTAEQPGTSTGPQSSASGTGRNPGGSGATGPDPAQSTRASTPATTDPSTPAGGDTPAGPTEPTGGSTTDAGPGEGGTNPNGAGGPDPVAGPAGAPVVAAGPAGTATSSSSDSSDSAASSDSLSLSPENTL
ncbi:hypothetical protein [Streptomyces sp. CCM_MD2014]|uniref:hypothetical protein n=1 Tax=Streptomyces sp. CCM_MD2014 TaxID=1561022 RepID=UPI0007764B6F|nr:hypothetical protein [Streptomyces sp. CCM_MD2014]